MHKWFMDSDDLANKLIELYEKFEKDASDCAAFKQSAVDNQIKINHVVQ